MRTKMTHLNAVCHEYLVTGDSVAASERDSFDTNAFRFIHTKYGNSSITIAG